MAETKWSEESVKQLNNAIIEAYAKMLTETNHIFAKAGEKINDITKHKWSDADPQVEACKFMGRDDILNLSFIAEGLIDSDHVYINLNKDDVIAIAKHFSSLMSPKDRGKFIFAILERIPQPETKSDVTFIKKGATFKGHHFGEIGKMKNNELFNKESDLHG